jgi:plasmid stabilization system protein ParE
MAVRCLFHPEALFEYSEAAKYYYRKASPRVAEAFVTAVEQAIAVLSADPGRGRVAEPPEIRRYVFNRFPYVIYYRWESPAERITIYAVMHCSREPGYWRQRIEQGS